MRSLLTVSCSTREKVRILFKVFQPSSVLFHFIEPSPILIHFMFPMYSPNPDHSDWNSFFLFQFYFFIFCEQLYILFPLVIFVTTKLLNIPQLIRQFHRICNRMAMHQLLIINLTKFNNSRTIPQMAEFREHGKVQTP